MFLMLDLIAVEATRKPPPNNGKTIIQ
jgi:hypothetical protein